jgi:hypothetical protein
MPPLLPDQPKNKGLVGGLGVECALIFCALKF